MTRFASFVLQRGRGQDVRPELRVQHHPGPRPRRHARGDRHGGGLPAARPRLSTRRNGPQSAGGIGRGKWEAGVGVHCIVPEENVRGGGKGAFTVSVFVTGWEDSDRGDSLAVCGRNETR